MDRSNSASCACTGWLLAILAAVVVLLVLVAAAQAGEDCASVRRWVAIYGERAAEQWARSAGWSEAKIRRARACLRKR